MASSSRPRRPSGGSRNTPGRPRRVAGRPSTPSAPASETAPDVEAREQEKAPEKSVPKKSMVAGTKPVSLDKNSAPKKKTLAKPKKPGQPLGPRTVPILVAAALVLAIGVAVEAYVLFGPPTDAIVVSEDKPVVIPEAEHAAAVDAADQAAVTIVSQDFENFDANVDEAAKTMTKTFAEEYRETSEAAKPGFVETKTVVTAEVVARSVMRASEAEVEALLFLNQNVTKDGGNATFTPYRAVATMVRDEEAGWLVAKLETQ